jgi:hypothetical protein
MSGEKGKQHEARADLAGETKFAIDEARIEVIPAEAMIVRQILAAAAVADKFISNPSNAGELALVRDARDLLVRLAGDLHQIPGFAANMVMAIRAITLIYSFAPLTEEQRQKVERDYQRASTAHARVVLTARSRLIGSALDKVLAAHPHRLPQKTLAELVTKQMAADGHELETALTPRQLAYVLDKRKKRLER